jgi:hypothetical protein
MKPVIQPGLKRGPLAERAALLLWLFLLAVLALSVLQGVGSLPS